MRGRNRGMDRAHFTQRPAANGVNRLEIILRTVVSRPRGAWPGTLLNRTLGLSERDNRQHQSHQAQAETGECAGIEESGMARGLSLQNGTEILNETSRRTFGNRYERE